MSAKIIHLKAAADLKFKKFFDELTYEEILAHKFRDLRHYKATYQGQDFLECSFTMCKKEWDTRKKDGSIGHLYNADLSNHLSRALGLLVTGYPSVNDRARASKGKKRVEVRYELRETRSETE